MTVTETTNLSDLLTADQERKRIDAMRRYRTRIKDAAAAGDKITPEQAGKLAEAATAAGVKESQIQKHIGAVATHRKYAARLKELVAEVPAAEARRKILVGELRTLNDKAQELRAAICDCLRPASERSHTDEAVRRLEFKHATIFNTEVPK